MHWLVEVSRVGDTVASERYCIDARRWQSALQEARRMRGDAGALPKLTIELTDSGYRAIDPQLKVRYVVSEAPPGMPLTDGARALLSTAPPPAVISAPPAGASGIPPAAPLPVEPPGASAPPAMSSAPAPIPVAPPVEPTALPRVDVAATPPPDATTVPTNVVAPVPHTPPPPPPLPSTQVIRQREEMPTTANPLAYRELALAVKSGTARADVEALLRAKLEELRAQLPEETRRYVQLAVFDHVFVKRPVRAPLGTLQWKDWRGEPTLSFPGFGDGSEAPPPSSISTSRMPSWAPGMMTSVAPVGGSLPPAPVAVASAPPPAAPAPAPTEPPRPSVIPARVVSVGPSAPPPAAAPVVSEPAASPITMPAAAPAPLPAPVIAYEEVPLPLTNQRVPDDLLIAEAARVAEAISAAEPERRSEPSPQRRSDPPSQRRSDPPSQRRSDPNARRSDPYLARRRGPGEDLIGDLFERMHELAFMPDIVSGADFVVRVLGDLIPCEATLVHVFDLGRREFVVVRARGPHAAQALMFRTPDTDPLVIEVMRRPSMAANGKAPTHSGAFGPLGVEPRQVMVRGARQGGRYLGLIELGNPQGGSPFHEGEVNALEYVCEQFAEFVASRPVVLDEDVVRA
ncbi:MAG TPA: hypothetical protein VNN72_19955 [Polyangiaceae bacterium]|nr:hypothetical protein [Polyangiaceae bacterium]